MKTITTLLALLIITTPLFAQRSSDIDGGKDYPLIARFEGAVIEYYKATKWDDYQIPCNFDEGFLAWEEPAKLEGKIFRTQYSVSPDNNPTYVLKMLQSTLEKDGFKVVLAQKSAEMGISINEFCDKHYNELKNTKFGFAYSPRGSDQSLIIAKANGKDIYTVIYVSGFGNTTLITQDVIEAETFTQKKVIATVFRGSSVTYDDKIGFDEFFICTDKSPDGNVTTKKIEGYIHHRFCYAPEGRSAVEIIKNYEEAIVKEGGKVLVSSTGQDECFKGLMKKGHPDHGLTNYEYMQFGRYAHYYFVGKVPGDKADNYVVVLAAKIDAKLVYALITIETKAMEKGMVSVDNLAEGIEATGHIAIYDILFDTGDCNIEPDSEYALKNIASYFTSNPDKKYLIVGHTDNEGDFDNNMILSKNRAKAVMDYLVNKLGVDAGQLKAYGASSLVPVSSNHTPEGKVKNRRVEIVEQ